MPWLQYLRVIDAVTLDSTLEDVARSVFSEAGPTYISASHKAKTVELTDKKGYTSLSGAWEPGMLIAEGAPADAGERVRQEVLRIVKKSCTMPVEGTALLLLAVLAAAASCDGVVTWCWSVAARNPGVVLFRVPLDRKESVYAHALLDGCSGAVFQRLRCSCCGSRASGRPGQAPTSCSGPRGCWRPRCMCPS